MIESSVAKTYTKTLSHATILRDAYQTGDWLVSRGGVLLDVLYSDDYGIVVAEPVSDQREWLEHSVACFSLYKMGPPKPYDVEAVIGMYNSRG